MAIFLGVELRILMESISQIQSQIKMSVKTIREMGLKVFY